MEFACRGRAAADEDAGYSGRSPDPPLPHEFHKTGAGDAMLVIRDALLLQLQKDRLRQEVIMAELAKLERSMSLCCTPRHGIDTTYLEQPKPQFFTFNEESMPQYRWSEHCSNVDEVHDLKKKDGKHGSVLLKSGKPATSTEDRFSVCSRSCCSSAKAEENNEAFGEQKLQESNEPKKMPPSLKWELTGITIPVKKLKTGITIPVKKPKTLQSWSCAICQVEAPNTAYNIQQHCAGNKHRSNVAAMESRNKAISQKAETTVETRPSSEVQQTMPQTPPSSIKWSCAICQAKATSEGNLQMHFAGQKHQRKVAALLSRKNANCQKATPAAEQARDVRQFSAEKPQPIWLCRFCQSKCTCKSDMENHLRGKRHKAKIQALLEECKNMVRSFGLTEAKLEPNIVTQDEENPESKWNCSLCQAKCTRQSELENHLKGKRHQLNFLVLQVEGQQYLSEWGCGICQAKCKSASQFEDHCMGRGHQQKIEALLRGGMNANSSGSQAVKKPPSDASNNKGGSSEEMATQKALYFCKLCNLLCNSKNTLAEHRRGKKHTEKVEKRMSSSYCKVCNLQCNSEKMLAHYCTGKTHLAKVNGC